MKQSVLMTHPEFFLLRMLRAIVRLIQREMEPVVVRIRDGEVYTSDEVIIAFRIGKPTLQSWMNDGLPCSQPFTRRQYFLGGDLLEFMAKHRKASKEVA